MKIKSIINPEAKTGVNSKGLKWSTSQVELEDGTRTYIFNPIGEGDEVESYQNGNFTNWRVKKTPRVSESESVIINMLTSIDKKLDKLLGTNESVIERIVNPISADPR